MIRILISILFATAPALAVAETLGSDLFELDCPRCLERVTTVAYPTVAEGRAHWDKLSADEKRKLQGLFQDKYLFSGDHLAWDPWNKRLKAFSGYVWHSWSQQVQSMERLAKFDFEWVIPGHGRLTQLAAGTQKKAMTEVIAWMKEQKTNRD